MTRVLAVTVALAAAIEGRAPSPDGRLASLAGYVLSTTGRPVPNGDVQLDLFGSKRSAAIEASGTFHLSGIGPGMYRVRVKAPGFTTRELRLTIPPQVGTTLTLPPIRLSPASRLRVRFVSRGGDPLPRPIIVARSFDTRGRPLEADAAGPGISTQADGTTMIGPLPRGVSVLALDSPPFARTRLPDLVVSGEDALIDGGVVVVDGGASLRVLVTDGSGVPLTGEPVRLDDGDAVSPLQWPPVLTDADGRAAFDSLAAGGYRLQVGHRRRCGEPRPPALRAVTVPASGRVETRIVMGGVNTTLRIVSGGVPLMGAAVSLAPTSPAATKPPWLRDSTLHSRTQRAFQSHPCGATTDAQGRVTFAHTPPGPAEVTVRLPYSVWMRNVEVPAAGGELPVDVPAGTASLRILDGTSRAPVAGGGAGMSVTWTAEGARIEGVVSPNGDVLLEGVWSGPGGLSIRARGYRPYDVRLGAPPAGVLDVALEREPRVPLLVSVVDGNDGHPVAHAAVKLTPRNPLQDTEIVIADAGGQVSFAGLPPAEVRITAAAHGFEVSTPATVSLPAHGGIVTVPLVRPNPP